MTDHAYDGTPIQEALTPESVSLTGEHAHFSIVGLREMVVVDTVYVDQPGNRARAYVTYTCRDIHTGEVVPHCRMLVAKGGVSDGDDDVLHKAQKLLPGSKSQKFTRQTQALDTDGERVLVGFIEGARARGVILGVLTHTEATYGAKAADGERRLMLHKGTSIEIKSDGNYHLIGSQDVQIRPAASKDIFLGDTGCTENLVLGQKFKQFASDLIDALLAATYPTGTGPSGPMLPPQSVTLTNLKAQLNDLLSDMAFTQKEQT